MKIILISTISISTRRFGSTFSSFFQVMGKLVLYSETFYTLVDYINSFWNFRNSLIAFALVLTVFLDEELQQYVLEFQFQFWFCFITTKFVQFSARIIHNSKSVELKIQVFNCNFRLIWFLLLLFLHKIDI
jgi:hypothetical protein